jgi:hypothetical protein
MRTIKRVRRQIPILLAVFLCASVFALQPSTLAAQGPAAHGPADGPAPAGDREAVLEVVLQLFEGMRTRDEALLRGVWHREARLLTAPSQPGQELRMTPIDAFVTGVLSGSAHLDEVIFDEQVWVDGSLAAVWAPYNLFVNGEFQHCGVDAVQLVREGQSWVIIQLVDTRTQSGCDRDRRSP